MSTATPPSAPGPFDGFDEAEILPLPPEEDLWEKYNKRLEFPFATVGAVLLHVMVVVLVIVFWHQMNASVPDKSDVPLVISNVDGLADLEGAQGAGNDAETTEKDQNVDVPKPMEPMVEPIPDIKETLKEIDPTGNIPVAQENAQNYKNVDKDLARKLLGGDGRTGTGPGGNGVNSARARSLRWVIRFNTRNGRDYLDQMAALGAVILIPKGNTLKDKQQVLLFENPRDRDAFRYASDADIAKYASQLHFSDGRRESILSVAGALGLDFEPKTFFVFFPKGMENDLAEKEKNFAGHKPEEIQETIMRADIDGNNSQIVVVKQTLRSGKVITK